MGIWSLRLRCWLFGHDWAQRIYFDAGRSVYSATCTKCGRIDVEYPARPGAP
jgi:hypothetical protein